MVDKSRSFKPIHNYPAQLFAIYQQKINQQQQLLASVKSILPADLAEHTLYCVLSGKKILLYTDSAAWSTQLRFYQSHIISFLKDKAEPVIDSLQVKLIPASEEKVRQTRAKIPCRENIEMVRQQALKETDAKLNQALLRLSETLQRLSVTKLK